ncbi:hypothetical protein [Mesorhizobium kowhaii]|uniref:hypothetical protein n=1 Tax=Mesorhizobium kowhaii TaxID=1300272 RepID=UPI001FDEF3E7|nr:hypothetical protein [Mesorhizobium kowhaii]
MKKMISPGFVAEILGAAFTMALTGALVAWLFRKVTRIGLLPSYALGITVMTFVAAALYVSGHDGTVDYLSAWIKYAIGGVVGFLILYTTSRSIRHRAGRSARHNCSPQKAGRPDNRVDLCRLPRTLAFATAGSSK